MLRGMRGKKPRGPPISPGLVQAIAIASCVCSKCLEDLNFRRDRMLFLQVDHVQSIGSSSLGVLAQFDKLSTGALQAQSWVF